MSYYNENINLNGIYCKGNSKEALETFYKKYNDSIQNSDLLACFHFNSRNIIKIQNYYSKIFDLPQILARSLEPFYQIQSNIIPWTHYLINKKVLVIHPFVKSFQKQLKNNFNIYKDKNKRIFLEEFIFYKSFQTIAGNHIHNNWFETFRVMCDDISKIDFDIALLGCGGYGLPLCNFIKMNMSKSAIYIGGVLQLLFGVMGERWKNNSMWKDIINENDSQFIYPCKEELCNNYKSIENGCYW